MMMYNVSNYVVLPEFPGMTRVNRGAFGCLIVAVGQNPDRLILGSSLF